MSVSPKFNFMEGFTSPSRPAPWEEGFFFSFSKEHLLTDFAFAFAFAF